MIIQYIFELISVIEIAFGWSSWILQKAETVIETKKPKVILCHTIPFCYLFIN